MSEKLTRLAERRAALVARSAHQRETLAQAAAAWRKPLALADRGISALGHLVKHPLLMAGSVAVVAVLRPRRQMLRWVQGGWLAWRIVRGIRSRLLR
jgi:YqjK-like protein